MKEHLVDCDETLVIVVKISQCGDNSFRCSESSLSLNVHQYRVDSNNLSQPVDIKLVSYLHRGCIKSPSWNCSAICFFEESRIITNYSQYTTTKNTSINALLNDFLSCCPVIGTEHESNEKQGYKDFHITL